MTRDEIISLIDEHSQTWKAVKRWAEQEIAMSQGKLEQPGFDAVATENERGAIKRLRTLLALAGTDAPAEIPDTEVSYTTRPDT